jgi:hypothetical protein
MTKLPIICLPIALLFGCNEKGVAPQIIFDEISFTSISGGKYLDPWTNITCTEIGEMQRCLKYDSTQMFDTIIIPSFSISSGLVSAGNLKSLANNKFQVSQELNNIDSIPANANYFEAALFANEFSKSKNLDTVYSYDSIQFVSGGATWLDGVQENKNANGYRLPTRYELLFYKNNNEGPEILPELLDSDSCFDSTGLNGVRNIVSGAQMPTFYQNVVSCHTLQYSTGYGFRLLRN